MDRPVKRWRSILQLREDYRNSGIDLGRPTVQGPGVGGCRGKVRHLTREKALEALTELKHGSLEHPRRAARLTVYECRWCHFHHIGHRRNRRQQ